MTDVVKETNAREPRTVFFESCRGVFQGGGCRAVALAGALSAATSRGVNFTGVSGTSAGSIVAALVGAGATPQFILDTLKALDLNSLLRPPIAKDAISYDGQRVLRSLVAWIPSAKLAQLETILKWGGRFSSGGIEVWLASLLKTLLPEVSGPILFQHLILPTFIVATDVSSNNVKIWSKTNTPSEPVAFAVRASCSIPLFFQPVSAGESLYVDGGILSNLPAFVFSDDDSTILNSEPILAFCLEEDEPRRDTWTAPTFVKRLVGAIIDGSTSLQLRLHRNVNTIAIPTGTIDATDFDKVAEREKAELVASGEKAMRDFLQEERKHFIANRQVTIPIKDEYEFLHAVVLELSTIPMEVVISAHESRWFWKLYPSFLNALVQGCAIRIALPLHIEGGDKNEADRRRMLREMNVQLVEVDNVNDESFVFRHADPTRSSAIVKTSGDHSSVGVATQYIGVSHSVIVQHQYADAVTRLGGFTPTAAAAGGAPSIQRCGVGVFEALMHKGVHQYRSAKIALRDIELSTIDASVGLIRSYKYRQIGQLASLFSANQLELFEPAMVSYAGPTSLVTPPVLEENGGRFLVIEGNTRIFYCWRHGIYKIKAIVVSDVTAPLPAGPVPLARMQLTSSYVDPAERFRNFNYDLFRQIERAVHQPS